MIRLRIAVGIIILWSFLWLVWNLHIVQLRQTKSTLSNVKPNNISTYKTFDKMRPRPRVELFCPIYENDSSQTYFLDLIYKNQFANERNIFLIFNIYDAVGYGHRPMGFGAAILQYISPAFALAIKLNRTFLLTGKYNMLYDKPYCKQFDAMDCLFEPLSNISSTAIQLLNDTNPSSILKGSIDIIFDLCVIKSACTQYKVVYIDRMPLTNSTLYFVRDIITVKWLQLNQRVDRAITHNEYQMILISFVMRLKPEINRLIMNKIKYVLNILKNVDKNTVISCPIRASDKCGTKYLNESANQINKDPNLFELKMLLNSTLAYAPTAEIRDCWTPKQIYLLLKTLKNISSIIGTVTDTVIITSEDLVFKKILNSYLKQDNSKDFQNVLYNKNDFSPGEGTVWYTSKLKNKQAHQYINITMSKNIATSLDSDGMVGALSSLLLQVKSASKYIVIVQNSNWLTLMWKFKYYLDCGKQQIRTVMNEKECVELIQNDVHYRNVVTKHLRLPKNMWQKIRDLQLTPDLFYQRYKVNILEYGWKYPCPKP